MHDSIIIQVERKEELFEAKRIMEEPFKELEDYSFPIKVKAGRSWYPVEEVKP